jgi:hypothetical protein
MIYKVSYVVIGGKHPGAIINQDTPPEVGKKVKLGRLWFEITDVQDLLPPQGDFAYLHATCRPVEKEKEQESHPA